MIASSLSLSSFQQIAEVKNFNSFKEIYLYLKEKASSMVIDILDHNQSLRENLIQLCTHYHSYSYRNGVQITDSKDESEQKLLSLARSQFDAGSFLGTLSFSVDLKNYLLQKTDAGYKNFVVYITFKYSPDNDTCLYYEEISGDRHLDLNIPDKIFYRYLPLLYQMTQYESCLNILQQAQKIPGGILCDTKWVSRDGSESDDDW